MNFRKLAMAFGIALAVSALCTLSLGRSMRAAAAQHKPSRHYVVPARPLNADEVLKADSIVLADWAGDTDVPGAFTKPADLVGRTVLYPIDKGQPITDKLVSAPGAGTGLAGKIPEGMRAIALRTDEVIGVAGFLVPGSRLDVLVTYHTDRSPEPVTATVVQNAEVLASGHQLEPDPTGKASVATVVTLLLSPEDAEKAALASVQGTIHFVMRSGSDSKVSNSPPANLSALGPQPAPPSAGGRADSSVSPSPEAHAHRHHEASLAAQVITVQTVLGDKQVSNTFEVGGR